MKKCGKTETGCQFGCPCLTPKKRDSGANKLSWLYFFNFWSLAPCIHSDGLGHSLLIDKGYETSSFYYCIYFVYICYPFALYFYSKWIQIWTVEILRDGQYYTCIKNKAFELNSNCRLKLLFQTLYWFWSSMSRFEISWDTWERAVDLMILISKTRISNRKQVWRHSNLLNLLGKLLMEWVTCHQDLYVILVLLRYYCTI